MITINYNTKQLYSRLQVAQQLLKKSKSSHEKIALANYIGNIYAAIMSITNKDVSTDKKRVFGSSKNYSKFQKKLSLYEDKMIEEYIKNKEFHHELFDGLLDGTDTYMDDFVDTVPRETEKLRKVDFDDIFFLFMKSINLEKMFDDFIKTNNIFATDRSEDNHYLGSIAFNPINKDMDIFLGDFNYDIHSLFTLAHEFGHVYDFNLFNEDVASYNRYFYQSFYPEVFSIMFERLFIDFMIKNKILVDDTKDKLIDMEITHHDYFTACYLLSLFENHQLATYQNENMNPVMIYELVKDNFDENIIDFLKEDDNLVVGESYSYGYGAFLSLFLKDSIDKGGLSNDMILEFLRIRSGLFDREFLDKYNLTADNFMDLYKKEIQFVKK